MNPTEKQRLLTIEFVKILEKAHDISQKAFGEIENIYASNSSLITFEILKRSENLRDWSTAAINNINVNDNQYLIQDIIKDLKTKLGELKPIGTHTPQEAYQKRDVVSAQLPVLERIEMDLTHLLRSCLQIVERLWIGKNTEENLGETPFALRLTGQSQFFSRPMTSLKDVELALDDITTRLDECIKLNDQDNDRSDDFWI